MAVLALVVVGLLLWWGYWRATDLDRDDRVGGEGRARCRAKATAGQGDTLATARDTPRVDRREVRTPSPTPLAPVDDTEGRSADDNEARDAEGDDPAAMPVENVPPRGDGQTQDYLQNLVFFLAAIPFGIAVWALRCVVQTVPLWVRAIHPADAEATPPKAARARQGTSRGRRRMR